MKIIVTRKDEVCQHCHKELPKGEIAWYDWYDELICDDCKIEKCSAEGEDDKMD